MGKFDSVKLSVPKYTAVLPSTNKKVQFSPFRVGDEKVLLIASQSQDPVDMIRALKTIIGNCVEHPVDEMEQYDIEYMFLQLRAKSVGETSEVGVSCLECESFNTIPIDLEAIVVDKQPNHTNIIKLTDTLAFEMKDIDPELSSKLDLTNPSDIITLTANSVKNVYNGDEVIEVEPTDVDEIQEVIENMTSSQFEMLQEYFRTKPKLVKDIDFVCGSCGHENNQRLEGLASFF